MSDSERNQVFAALRGPIIADPLTNSCLDKIAQEDSESLEPVISEIVRTAEKRARFELWLEICDGNLRRRMAA